jgi:hypothetical protein
MIREVAESRSEHDGNVRLAALMAAQPLGCF